VLLVVITSCQGWRTLLYPHEFVRTPAVAVLLALLVLLTPSPAGAQPGRVRRTRSTRRVSQDNAVPIGVGSGRGLPEHVGSRRGAGPTQRGCGHHIIDADPAHEEADAPEDHG
jgi:hypothetical protein